MERWAIKVSAADGNEDDENGDYLNCGDWLEKGDTRASFEMIERMFMSWAVNA